MENSNTPWTPGPWEACRREDYMDDGIVILGDDRRIAVVNTGSDARLIAAAPELLEALEAMLTASQPQHSLKHVFIGEAQELALSSIKKAKGE